MRTFVGRGCSLLFYGLFLFSLKSHAVITVNSISGASNFDVTTSASQPIIYGGRAGNCLTTDGVNTCDSCASSTTTACNNYRIYDGLALTINFTVSGEVSGVILASKKDGALLSKTSTSGTLSKGNTGSITFTWGTLCNELTGTTTCDSLTTHLTDTMRIGIDNNANNLLDEGEYTTFSVKVVIPTNAITAGADYDGLDCTSNTDGNTPAVGICSFTAGPGDGKVEIKDLNPEGDFPNTSGIKISHQRFYFNTVGFPTLNYATTTYEDIAVVDEGASLDNKFIKGLENDTIYYFRTASIDEARNVFALTNDTEVAAQCPGGPAAPADGTCPLMATPDEVFGLLTEDLNCFLTTAAYGSSFHSKVNDFRSFRNEFLAPYTFGKKIINFYYSEGPKWAQRLHSHSEFKPFVRAILFPLWMFAFLSVKIGLLNLLFSIVAGIGLATLLFRKGLRSFRI